MITTFQVEFFDLPSDVFLGLQDAEIERLEKKRREAERVAPSEDERSGPCRRPRTAAIAVSADRRAGWRARLRHLLGTPFRAQRGARAAIAGRRSNWAEPLRELEEDAPRWRAENLVREAYMRRRIEEAIAAGHKPERIVAVVGAFHAPVLTGEFPAMTDEELASLRRRTSKLTLMPYSYFRLSSQSGYGAGNQAPAYFELLWEALNEHGVGDLSRRYLSLVARKLREAGTHRSTAEVIDGVRLAETLSAMKNGLAPTLRRPARRRRHAAGSRRAGDRQGGAGARRCRHGDRPVAQGRQPDVDSSGLRSRAAIASSWKSTAPRFKQELDLDLRENRRVKSEEAAFLDLHRSSFFHRLRVLGIAFAKPAATAAAIGDLGREVAPAVDARKRDRSWSRRCCWARRSNWRRLTSSSRSSKPARPSPKPPALVRDACQCGLMKSMELARRRLQELAATSSEFAALAAAAWQLSLVVRYGDVRPLRPRAAPAADGRVVRAGRAGPRSRRPVATTGRSSPCCWPSTS